MTYAELAEEIEKMTDEQKSQHVVGTRFGESFTLNKLDAIPANKDRNWVWASSDDILDEGHPILDF